jgi:hypothetical protein
MLTVTAVLALVLAYVALVTAYLALRTLAKLRRATVVLAKGAGAARGQETVLESIERHIRLTSAVASDVQALRADLITSQTETDALLQHERDEIAAYLARVSEEVAGHRSQLDADLDRNMRNVALVRYDAFDDMAGRMSFSLAMLDDHGDGVTLSAITGRSDTRIYAKGVRAGYGEHELSPEEAQAVLAALRSGSTRSPRRRRTDRRAS